MNCQSCGAPIPTIDSDGNFRCVYCRVITQVEVIEGSIDRIVLTANESDHSCPICFSKLVNGAIDEIAIEGCTICQGILIDKEAFALVVHLRRANYDAKEVPSLLNPVDLERKIDCPQCGRRMENFAYYGPGNPVIDSCGLCKLVWLDVGELTSIERAPGQR